MIFLDTEFPQGSKNGIELGRLIRDVYENNTVSIVYISWEIKYSMQLFKIRPFDFLIKPLKYKQVEQVIKTYLKIARPWDGEFIYRVDYTLCRVKRRDIVYLESFDRKLILHLANGRKEEFYGALRDAYEEQLQRHDFLFIHASYVVNYNYIAKFKYEEVSLTTGGPPLPISQPRRKEIRKAYLAIMKRRRE